MTFLNPLILFGLIAAGIPLLIHLFNFRRPQKVDFSSLAFLRELQSTTMQRVKIKQWLLLLLRTLAIASLVLSFARPTLKGSIASVLGGDAESASVLVLDNSLSMTVRDVDGVLLDQARETARGFAELFGSGDQVAVIRTSDRNPDEIRWLKSRQAVEGEIDETEPSAIAMSISEAVTHAGRLLGPSSFVNREVFVLSDFQTATLGDSLTSDFPAGVPVRLVKIGSQDVVNTAVTDVVITSQIVEPNRPVRMEATISGTGSESGSSALVSVFLDGERSAQSEVEVPANSVATTEFVVTPRRTGWLEGVVELEDDAFQNDNRRYFTIAVPETRRVLLVRGAGFRSNYLNLALSAEVAPGRTRFDLDVVTPSGLSSARVSDYDVLILAGVSDLSSGQISAVGSFAEAGGGLLIFPSVTSDASATNDVLARLGGGSVERTVSAAAAGAPVAVIDEADTEHTLFEGVFQIDDATTGPRIERLDVFRYSAYRSANAAEITLMRLSTGHPFLQEIPVGRGKALFMASLPVPEWSELPVRGLFVPLIYRALSYLSSGESPAGDDLTIGRGLDVLLPGSSESDVIIIAGADQELVPPQRPSFGGVVVTIGDEVETAGVYDVRIGQRLARKISANLDPVESDLRTGSGNSAANRLKGGSEIDVREMLLEKAGGPGFAAAVATMRTGLELWNVFLGVALVILLAEMLVSRLWKPEAASG
ncbi:MAG: VWA domain-containing protein [Rhodothermales bacterium]|nr:VWA domain-containing protein [Rhodothermales bacterium]